MYGEAVTDRMCQKWFMKFCAGDFLLDDAPQSGRPVEVDSDQINTLIENNQHYTTREIANILKISKSIELFVKMKNVSFILWKKLNGLFGQPNIAIPQILLKNKKEWTINICKNMDKYSENYAEWKRHSMYKGPMDKDKGACGLPRRLFTGFIEFLLLHKDRCLGPSVLLILGMEGWSQLPKEVLASGQSQSRNASGSARARMLRRSRGCRSPTVWVKVAPARGKDLGDKGRGGGRPDWDEGAEPGFRLLPRRGLLDRGLGPCGGSASEPCVFPSTENKLCVPKTLV